jgi:hypothetical protein
MPRADICFFFRISLESAIERNQNREKVGKESDREISDRYFQNLDFTPLAEKTVYFENNGRFENKAREFLLTLWKLMAQEKKSSFHLRRE